MSLDGSYSTEQLLVDMAEQKLRYWVGPDATRAQAEQALEASPRLRSGLSDEIRARVLDRFDADPDPVAYVDYLPDATWRVIG